MRSLFAMMILMATLVVAGCNDDADTGTTTTTTTPNTTATDTDGTTAPANGATDNP